MTLMNPLFISGRTLDETSAPGRDPSHAIHANVTRALAPKCGMKGKYRVAARSRTATSEPGQTDRLDILAGATGLEPAASGVTGRRSNQLSYAPASLRRT